ncbi:ring-1,2-phenylacetyl-CoA epoxidase subunit PaaD [Chitinophaga sp. CF118]|uniref:1,2-phenylacetyl-CoA epoxidase subunit PaaD n=1 Tax=Chitinophaga sp. CF118 TaxID=1884367 RepID=UPI0008E20D54|nr:1,2-phenylacetyl-CoA epoxidase subunit PaaD [Chitinophaga sp. CF118]SFE68687.1 ring-1,2-phenylacetyl-CoA epoxidase subunit PaaD [Chitinophaga sp. CF118]
MDSTITIQAVYTSLEQVMDPEIPVLNVLELGMITEVIMEDEYLLIKMIPTFAACPAVEIIKKNIKTTLEKDLQIPVQVSVDKEVQWNSNRLTETAKEKLRNFRIAPPQHHNGEVEMDLLIHTTCPHCGSENTYLRSPFGSTLCRAIHFCKNCGMMFEQFKPLS